MFWTSEPSSTIQLGRFTGTSDDNAKKPPLAPKRTKRRRKVAVLYIDPSYWDVQMTDVPRGVAAAD